jgi:hypothetical protein
MGARLPFTEKEAVQAGKPLPFSIFGPDGKLLLAQGQVVESERMCESLRDTGVTISRANGDAQVAASNAEPICPITKLSRDYVSQNRHTMAGLKMSRDGSEDYTTWVIGMNQRKVLILSQPIRPDKSLVPVLKGDTWTFRTFHATSVFRFSATILNVAFEPFPHLHIEMPRLVDKKSVRKSPRATVAMLSKARIGDKEEKCFVADLSAQGARVALPARLNLAKDDRIEVELTVKLADRQYPLKLDVKIASTYGASDPQHPEAAFYGLFFDQMDDADHILLHACVYEKLVTELDSLWQALSIPGA